MPRHGSLFSSEWHEWTDLSVSTHFWQSRHPCDAVLPTLGLSWAQLRRQMPHTGPQLGPSWSQLVWARRKLRPKSGPSGLLFGPTYGQGRPSLTPVSFWLGQALLSVKFPGCGRFSSRSDIYIYITYITHTYQITTTYHKYMCVCLKMWHLFPSCGRQRIGKMMTSCVGTRGFRYFFRQTHIVVIRRNTSSHLPTA